MPLPPADPGTTMNVDYFDHIMVTPRGSYILQGIDRFSRHVKVFGVMTTDGTAQGTTNILINRYFPLWRCLCSILSDTAPKFF